MKFFLFLIFVFLSGYFIYSTSTFAVEKKIEPLLGIDLPTDYKVVPNGPFAGPGDYAERYELVYSVNGYKTLVQMLDLSGWKKLGSGYTKIYEDKGKTIILYLGNPPFFNCLQK